MNAQNFPFYTDENLLNHRKTWCESNNLFRRTVLCKEDPTSTNLLIKFPPFQIVIEGTTVNLDSFFYIGIIDKNIGEQIDITRLQLDVFVDTNNNKTIITHYGQLWTDLGLPNYQIPNYKSDWAVSIYVNNIFHSSESFYPMWVSDDDMFPCGDWLILDATSNKNIGSLIYEDTGSFKQSYLLPTDIGRPTYEYKEQGEEDGTGEFFQTSKRVEKTFTFEFFAPEYMTDALSLLPLHNTFVVFTKYGSHTPNDLKFQVKSWETDCIARCEISFQTDFAVMRGTI